MKSFHKGAMAASLALALSLTACAGGSSDSKTGDKGEKETNTTAQVNWNPQPRDNIKDGGTWTYAIGEIGAQGNPREGTSEKSAWDIWGPYNPGLFNMTPEGELVPDKAYVLDVKDEVKDEKTVVTYTLNPEAKFNDGTPIDVKSFQALFDICNGKPKGVSCNNNEEIKRIESVKAGKDNYEVVVTFEGLYPWWQTIFSSPIHPKLADPQVFNEGYKNGNYHPEWGAGPFKLEKVDKASQTVSYVRNEKWWGDQPKLEKIVLKVLQPEAELNAFKNGEIDVTTTRNKERLAKVQGTENMEIRRGSRTSNVMLVLNGESIKDKEVRQAIFRGINRDNVMKIVFNGLDYTETAPGSFLLYQYQKGYQDNLTKAGLTFDPEKAKQQLEDAGWKLADGEEYRMKDGKKLSLRFPIFGDDATVKAQAEALANMMKQIGIELKIEVKASADFGKVLQGKDYEFFIVTLSSGDPNGVTKLGSVYGTGEGLNIHFTSTKELDKKIEEVSKLPTAEEQIKAANEVEVEALAQAGVLPMYNGPQIIAVKKGLANFGVSVFGSAPLQDIGWQKDAA